MGKQLVIALGGNALGNTPEEQKKAILSAADNIVNLVRDGHRIVIVHGNGPQVGMINLAFELAGGQNRNVAEMPFAECCAMSQGYIGFHLQNTLQNSFFARGMSTHVSTAIKQVVVDRHDPAFTNPTKPVGLFYTEDEAKAIAKDKAYSFIEDSGRGFRRVVASPDPIDIKEKGTIRCLMENGDVVIACGGGGIPVYREDGMLHGIDAVIDKDKAAAKLKEEESRHIKEELSEAELELFDLLRRDKLTQKEEQKVKLAAKELFKTLTEKKQSLFVVGWVNDSQPKERVKNEIVLVLNQHLPESYERELFTQKINLVYEHILDLAMTGYDWVA